MKQYLLLTSAFVAGGLLSGTAGAACIKTPTCSSLGYESTTSCSGGTKCPFGNAWNCDSVNKITELTNKITELETKVTTVENNSTAGPRCADCKVGDYVCAGQCFSPEKAYYHDATGGTPYIEGERWLNNLCTGFVIEKSNGECRQIPTMYAYEPVKTISVDEFEKDPNTIITKDADGSISRIENKRILYDCMAIQKIENEYYWPVIDSCVYSLLRTNGRFVDYHLIEVSNDHYDHVFSTKSYRDRSSSYIYPIGTSFAIEKALQDLSRGNRLKVLNVTTFK